MEKLQINCPEGYEIDQDKSNLSQGIVYFKEIKKQLTYDDIAKKLFSKSYYYIASDENIKRIHVSKTLGYRYSNNGASIEQLESLLALNKLINVANYLNDGWVPDWYNVHELKFYINFRDSHSIDISYIYSSNDSNIFFKTRELAQKAIEILGEAEIKKALTLNHISTT